jgi:hypothetical protein
LFVVMMVVDGCRNVLAREFISHFREISVNSREIKSKSRENMILFREIMS